MLNAKNNAETTLSVSINSSVTSLTVADASVLPVVPFVITIDNEIMTVTNVVGNVLTVTRGAESTTPTSHLAGVSVENRWTAGMYKNIWKIVYPVGAIYISTVATNPASIFGGGTWSAFGTGRTLVGVDAGQTEFDTVEETGGAKTHTLVADEMPVHIHNSIVSDRGQALYEDGVGSTAGRIGVTPNTGAATNYPMKTSAAGGGLAHNNLQPYITVYMWKRTA